MKNIAFYIPALNSGKYLERCIQSILKIKSAGVFVIDGGSSDKTTDIAKKYNLKVIRQEGIGLAAARNTAIRHSRTEFIGFIDSDCEIDRKWLEFAYKHFKDEKVAGVCGKVIEKIQATIPDRWRKFHLRQDWGDKKSRNPAFIYGSNLILRLSSLKKISGFNEKYKSNYEDVDISKRLKSIGFTLIYEPKAICYHLRKDNLTSVIKTARQWSFFSYPEPNSLANLLMRLFVYNPHQFLVFFIMELAKFKTELLLVTLFSFFYSEYYDFSYFIKKAL